MWVLGLICLSYLCSSFFHRFRGLFRCASVNRPMPSSPRTPRSLACARCFRLKRRCDHAKPTCGECKRRGTECLPVKSSKDGDNITVSLRYLKSLEARIAELEGRQGPGNGGPVQVRDIGLQTDPQDNVTGVDTANMDMVTEENHSTLESCPSFAFGSTYTPAPGTDTMLGGPHPGAQRLEAPLISRIAYEMYLPHASIGCSPWAENELLGPPNNHPPLLEEVYTDLYFTITHWVWPFLNSSVWRLWYHEWTHDKGSEQWKGFFVLMVHAIGALLQHGLHPNQGYAARAADIYTSAMAYYPHVMSHSSAILQIKASILMILYSLHCPSSEEIAVTVSSIVPFCAATMSELRKQSSNGGDDQDETGASMGETLTEPLFITCYMLNEIIISGWDRPVSATYRAIDDDV